MSQCLLHSFERHLIAQGKRPSTVDCYAMIVSRFLRDAGVPAEAVTAEHAYAFLVERGNALGRSASWYNVMFHAVVAWLTMRGLPTDLRGLRPMRVALQPPRWFTGEVAVRLLDAVTQRHFRLFFQTMLATGMRVSEVLALRVADLDPERPLLRVVCGKGGDGRLVNLHPVLRQRMRDYWRVYRPRGVFFQRYPGRGDEPMQARTVNAALQRAAVAAGIPGPVSTHRLRHTFAMTSLRAGTDLVTLQKILGHRCLDSTARYLTPDLIRARGERGCARGAGGEAMIGAIAFAHGDDPVLLAGLRDYQRRALEDIAGCGTAACGMHVEICDHCGDQRLSPNTCQNRSCPHCQGRARAEWVAARAAELLPCGYFHVVLTCPSDLRGLAQAYPTVVLGALLRAAGESIERLCADPRFLGAEVGQLAVLHTWRRDLGWHPHVHLIVTAGGWDAAQQRWIPARRHGQERRPFLVPALVLRRCFAGRLKRLLHAAYRRGDFATGPQQAFAELSTAPAFAEFVQKCLRDPPVARIEAPFGSPANLLKYLGAYVNRVAISPSRILAHDPDAGTVTYTWRTNRDPGTPQQATISARDFLHRFAQHVLPPRFMRIRFRGLWSTAHRASKLLVVQRALDGNTAAPATPDPTAAVPPPDPPGAPCPACGQGHYHRVPGPCPRPPRRLRRRTLNSLRSAWRLARHTPNPMEAVIPV